MILVNKCEFVFALEGLLFYVDVVLLLFTLACNEGHFGTHCSRVCSPYCKPKTCRHTDGSCNSCTAGWMGHNCTKGR